MNSKQYPTHHIKLQLPLNCTAANEHYYSPLLEGDARACHIEILNNYYANRELLLWKNGNINPLSFASAPVMMEYYEKPIPKIKFLLKKTYRKTKKIEKPVLWCIDNYSTGGYYHWIAEILPRLWMAREYIQDSLFAVPDYFIERWPFVTDYLKLLGVDNLLVLDTNTNYLIQKIIMPTRAGETFFRQEEPLEKGIEWLKEKALLQADKKLGKRLYISRDRANYRKVLNESEIIPILEKYDFERVFLEDYSLSEQISICNNAEIIMGIHGAGLTNMLFLEKNTKLIDIRPKKVYNMYNIFFTLSYHAKSDYFFILCDYAPQPLETDRRIDDHSVVINPTEFDIELSKILI
jgi:hypothetical protein